MFLEGLSIGRVRPENCPTKENRWGWNCTQFRPCMSTV